MVSVDDIWYVNSVCVSGGRLPVRLFSWRGWCTVADHCGECDVRVSLLFMMPRPL